MAVTKKGAAPLELEKVTQLRDCSRTRVPIEGLNSGVAVMYLDPAIIDSLTSEILRARKRDSSSG